MDDADERKGKSCGMREKRSEKGTLRDVGESQGSKKGENGENTSWRRRVEGEGGEGEENKLDERKGGVVKKGS